MKAINKINSNSRLGGVGVLNSHRRATAMILVASVTLVAIALAMISVPPNGKRSTQLAPTFHSQNRSPFQAACTVFVSRSANPQSENKIPSVVGEIEQVEEIAAIYDLCMDGLEFAVAGLEVSGTFGPLMQAGNSLSEIAHTISLPEGTAKVDTTNTISVSDRRSSSPARDMTAWMLQNAPRAR